MKSKKSMRKKSSYQQKMKKYQTFDDLILTWIKQSDRRDSTLSDFNEVFDIENFIHSFDAEVDV
jgi:hypothetical protein